MYTVKSELLGKNLYSCGQVIDTLTNRHKNHDPKVVTDTTALNHLTQKPNYRGIGRQFSLAYIDSM